MECTYGFSCLVLVLEGLVRTYMYVDVGIYHIDAAAIASMTPCCLGLGPNDEVLERNLLINSVPSNFNALFYLGLASYQE